MQKPFTWERGPFEMCANCKEKGTFGILSFGGYGVTKRCTKCRYLHTEVLPTLDKKVIYLDQFAFSELHKLRSGTRKNDKWTAFWSGADALLNRAMLLQQLVLPHSNIHHNETIVSPFPGALRETQEAIGGDIRLLHTNDIQLHQIKEFARAFFADEEPVIDFNVHKALDGEWNEWLSDMRITVGMDWSSFVPATRRDRKSSHASVSSLVEGWRKDLVGFDEILERELGAYLQSRQEALIHAMKTFERGFEEKDPLTMFNLNGSFVQRELQLVRQLAREAGVPEEEVGNAVRQFWASSKNREQPFGRIIAYMFAALAGQVKGGRTKMPTPGFMNDVQAIAAYAPYVDAMFIDKECAELLRHGRCRKELSYKARIFSLSTTAEFIEYMRSIVDATPDNVRVEAELLYGLDPNL